MDAESEQQIPQRTRTSRTVKLSTKAQETKIYTSDQNYLRLVQDTDAERLIV